MEIHLSAHALYVQRTHFEMRHTLFFSTWMRFRSPDDREDAFVVAYYVWMEGADPSENVQRHVLTNKGESVKASLIATGEPFWDTSPYSYEGDHVDLIDDGRASLTYMQRQDSNYVMAVFMGEKFPRSGITWGLPMRQYSRAAEDNQTTMRGAVFLYKGTSHQRTFLREETPFNTARDPAFSQWTRASARWSGPHPFGE